jgi:hypothetical protein
MRRHSDEGGAASMSPRVPPDHRGDLGPTKEERGRMVRSGAGGLKWGKTGQQRHDVPAVAHRTRGGIEGGWATADKRRPL